jgi:HlyD family secretion protein/epimerase transport system membrane fusion protein
MMLGDFAQTPVWKELQGLWTQYAAPIVDEAEALLRAAGWTDPAHQWVIMIPVLLGALGSVVILALGARRGRRSLLTGQASLASMTRAPRLFGYSVVVVLGAGLGGWASTAPLASAALAPGVVSPDGYRKTIQHLEGGIVQAIHVREGDLVAVGHELVTLDETQARARHKELRERYADLLAMEARLLAERNGSEDIVFPEELAAMADVDARRSMDGQASLLASRRATRMGREQILEQRILQLDEEITGLKEMIAAQDEQLALLEQEVEGAQTLYDEGLESLPRLLALRRAKAEIDGQKAANRAQIARKGQEIGETRMQVLTMRDEEAERVNEELTKVRGGLAELRSQLASRKDVLTRTVVRAPISGTVMNVRVTTESGVLMPGEPILDIVPVDGKLIIDARVTPNDIDNVRPGLEARVLLTGYRQRSLPQIHGVLRSISADSLVEDRSGNSYYLAKVEVDPDDIAQLEDIRLIPGMPADVMILNGERTFLDYILRPLMDSVTRSFRES